MALEGKRVFVVEEDFRVALDIQFALESARVQQAIFARSIDEAMTLSDRWREFDLVILGLPERPAAALELLNTLHQAGVAVVATFASTTHQRATALEPRLAVAIKPFAPTDLLGACKLALERLG